MVIESGSCWERIRAYCLFFFSLGFHEKPWKLLRRNFLWTIHILRTGYSLSDQHILPPINPKYDDWFCQIYKDIHKNCSKIGRWHKKVTKYMYVIFEWSSINISFTKVWMFWIHKHLEFHEACRDIRNQI